MVTNMWRWFFKRNPQATRRLRRSYFPQFERLETREVPATMIWTGPSGGSDPWNTAADWTDAASASTHHVPTAADDVIIPYDGSSLKNYTVTISAGDPGAVAHSLSIGATNTLDFSGSSLTLSAPSVINPGATLALSGSATKSINGTGPFVDANSITQVDGGSLQLASTMTLNIVLGGLYDLQSNANITGGTLINGGTFQKSVLTGTSKISSTFNNAGGKVEVLSGTLVLPGKGTNTGGTFDASTGATLDVTGGGTTAVFTGTYQDAGGGGTVELATGTLRVGAAGVTFDFSSSTPFQWIGGTIMAGTTGLTNSDSFNIGSGSLAKATTETLFGLLINTGTGTITQAGTSTLKTSSGSTLNNQGLYDLQSSASTVISGNGLSGSGTLINSGTFQKSAGTVATIASTVPFNNVGGTVSVQTGTLNLPGAGTSDGGTFDASTGAVLDVTGGGGTKAIIIGSFTDAGGGGTIQMSKGILTVGSARDAIFNFSASTPFQWIGGTISGGANGLTNTGSFTVSAPVGVARTETLNGKLTNSAAGTITQTNISTVALSTGATLINQGDYELQSTAKTVISGTGILVNNGTFDRSGGSSGSTAKISAIVNNPGTLEVDVGTLTLTSTVTQLTGSTLTGGTWNVSGSCTLNFTMGLGITTIGDNATVALLGAGATFTKISALEFNYGTFTLDGGATFTTSGDLFNVGTITVGTGSTTSSGSVLTVSGNFFEFGTLNIHVGSSPNDGEFGQVAVSGDAALAGTFNESLVNSFSPSSGQTFAVITFSGSTFSTFFFFSTVNAPDFSSTTVAPFTDTSTEFDLDG